MEMAAKRRSLTWSKAWCFYNRNRREYPCSRQQGDDSPLDFQNTKEGYRWVATTSFVMFYDLLKSIKCIWWKERAGERESEEEKKILVMVKTHHNLSSKVWRHAISCPIYLRRSMKMWKTKRFQRIKENTLKHRTFLISMICNSVLHYETVFIADLTRWKTKKKCFGKVSTRLSTKLL